MILFIQYSLTSSDNGLLTHYFRQRSLYTLLVSLLSTSDQISKFVLSLIFVLTVFHISWYSEHFFLWTFTLYISSNFISLYADNGSFTDIPLCWQWKFHEHPFVSTMEVLWTSLYTDNGSFMNIPLYWQWKFHEHPFILKMEVSWTSLSYADNGNVTNIKHKNLYINI